MERGQGISKSGILVGPFSVIRNISYSIVVKVVRVNERGKVKPALFKLSLTGASLLE